MNSRIPYKDFFNPKNIFQTNTPTFVEKKVREDLNTKFLNNPEYIGKRLNFPAEIRNEEKNIQALKDEMRDIINYNQKQLLINKKRIEALSNSKQKMSDNLMETEGNDEDEIDEEEIKEEIIKKAKNNKLTR